MDNYFRIKEVFPIGDSTSFDSSNFYYSKPKKKKKSDEFDLILLSKREAYELSESLDDDLALEDALLDDDGLASEDGLKASEDLSTKVAKNPKISS